MSFLNVSVESPQSDVEPYGLGSGSPKGFMFVEADIRTVRQNRS